MKEGSEERPKAAIEGPSSYTPHHIVFHDTIAPLIFANVVPVEPSTSPRPPMGKKTVSESPWPPEVLSPCTFLPIFIKTSVPGTVQFTIVTFARAMFRIVSHHGPNSQLAIVHIS